MMQALDKDLRSALERTVKAARTVAEAAAHAAVDQLGVGHDKPEAYLGGITDKSFAEDGSLTDPALAKVVKRVAIAFADWVMLIKSGRAALAGDPAHQG